MKRHWLLVLALICAGLLFACAAQTVQEDRMELWFLSAPGREKLPPAFGTTDYEGEETVPDLMAALLNGPPLESGLAQAIPSGVQMLSWKVENRVAQLELSTAYSKLSGIDLTLADYSIVLTLTQLDGIDGVCISVRNGGQDFWNRPILKAGDVLFTGAEEEPVEVYACLYFLEGGVLGYEEREFRLTEDQPPAQAVLDALIAGPEQEELSALLPDGLAIRSVRVDDGLCRADFSSELLENVPEDPELQELTLSSIVETLCSLDQIEQVQILVEGEPLEQYGAIHLSGPLYPAAR